MKLAYTECGKEWKEKQDFWFLREGRELQLNLVAQGYEINLFIILLTLSGSEFIAIKIIKNLMEEIHDK